MSMVLNLIINGLPSIRDWEETMKDKVYDVLNLIINGLPSILLLYFLLLSFNGSFKPYYKWITFNTLYAPKFEDQTLPMF